MKSHSSLPAALPAGKERVVRGVVQGLLRSQWQGGDRLTEAEAAELFKVSRTPVREALLELASMGIVELKRNCGAIFRPFGPTELQDLYAVRSLLEVEAARLAATRITEDAINRLKADFDLLRQEKRPDTGWRLDRELHATIANASGNPRLADEIARYNNLVQTMREAVGNTQTNVHPASQQEHLEILQCIQKHDAALAAEAMRRHLEHAAESAVAALTNLRERQTHRV